ncbi:hypothetical protein BGX21_011083 [Mortierella sp. AD011]|nr:hypothetical protein BGX21_011083 [Mortierella sp. AD011]
MSSRPINMLRPKASSASISSNTSTSSNTTAQTFMTSFSFSTITGSHDRSVAQEDLLSSSAGSYSSTGVPAHYGENYDEGREDKEVDVESLDIAITTPTDNIHINPFDHQHDPVLQLQSSTWSKGHNKSFSQQSAVTIKGRQFGGSSSNMAAAVLPSPLTSPSSTAFRQQIQRVDEETAKDAGDADGTAEDMMFASPDYRKSISLSDHSDLALDSSSPPGETSSGNTSEMAQYTNLLRDATTIIEQQHLQDHITSKPLEDHESEDVGIDSNNVHYSRYLRHNAEPSIGSSCSRDMRSSSHISDAGSTAEKMSVSSGRNTLRSQSRRFSAPGHPGSSHTSLASISNASEASQAGTESATSRSPVTFLAPVSGSRGPQSFVDNDEPNGVINRMYLPGLYSNNSHLAEGTSFKRAFHPPQHHTTMQAYAEKEPAGPESSVATSSAAQHQPHLHRDYRPGVVFEYYEGEWDWLPNFDEMRPDNVGIVGNFMIDDTTEQDLFRARYSHQTRRQFKESGNFAVRFTTYIDITQDGVYSFWLSSNDGSVLYVSNRLVVENDGMHYATEAEGRIMLQAGKHAMTVEFFHKNGKMLEGFRSTGPSLIVSYRAPGPIWSFGLKPGPKKIIKSNNLFFDHGGWYMVKTAEIQAYSTNQTSD